MTNSNSMNHKGHTDKTLSVVNPHYSRTMARITFVTDGLSKENES